MTSVKPVALYVHIPFCRAKCAYCDFASTAGMEHLIPQYVEAVQSELARLPDGPQLETIYLGGGTPSLLSPAQVKAILVSAYDKWGYVPVPEITMEANPGTIDGGQLAEIQGAGANRLSIGVQSLDDQELRMLGRIHTAEQAILAIAEARAAGFHNLSIDLIYGLPGQTISRWEDNLKVAVSLGIEHLSLYCLTLEEGTPLAGRVSSGYVASPDDDTAADMYSWAEEYLEADGWDHYELSNWARLPEFRCRHNTIYWHNQPYWGVGAAAHSSWDRRRRWNLAGPEEYIAAMESGTSPIGGSETIDRRTEMGETMMLGLRLTDGIAADAFQQRFGVGFEDVFRNAIDEGIASGLLERANDRWRLTRRGRLLANEVVWRFWRDAQARGDLCSVSD